MADELDSIYRARLAELLKKLDDGTLELTGIHAKLATEIIAQLRALPDNRNVTTSQLQEMIEQEVAKTLPKRARVLRDSIEDGAYTGRKAARQTIRLVLGADTEDKHVRATAKALSEAGERIAGRVTVDGVGLTKRIRRNDAEVVQQMAYEVQQGLRQRKGVLGVARKIEAIDTRTAELPAYLRELEQHARLGHVDEVKKLAKSYAKRIAQMGEAQVDGAFIASKYSLRSATKRFVADVQKASLEGIDGVVARYVRERMTYQANRIARSESVEAMRSSYVAQTRNKPGIVCYEWRLSNRHATHAHGGSRQDVCDVLAAQNAHSLGPGRYPADHVPKLPHAFCTCSVIAVVDAEHFERAESERGRVPADMRDHKSPGALDWLKQNDAAAAKILGPTRFDLMHRGVNVLNADGSPKLVRDLLGHAQAAE